MNTCPHCDADYEPNRKGAVRDKCARCYQWSNRHPGEPIPPRGQARTPITGPLRMSFALSLELKALVREAAGPGKESAYVREAVEEKLAREATARARDAGITVEED